jgi:hypothetical protein
MAGERDVRVVLARNQQQTADNRWAVYVKPLGGGRHLVRNIDNARPYRVGSALGSITFKPGSMVMVSSNTGAPGEIIIGMPPPGRRGGRQPIVTTRTKSMTAPTEPPTSQDFPTGRSYWGIFSNGTDHTTWYCYDYTDGTVGSQVDSITGSGVNQTNAGRLARSGIVEGNNIYWSDGNYIYRWDPISPVFTRVLFRKAVGYSLGWGTFTNGTNIWCFEASAASSLVGLARCDMTLGSVTHSASEASFSPDSYGFGMIWEDASNVYAVNTATGIGLATCPKDMTGTSYSSSGYAGSVSFASGIGDQMGENIIGDLASILSTISPSGDVALWPAGWSTTAANTGQASKVSTGSVILPLYDTGERPGAAGAKQVKEVWGDALAAPYGDSAASVITPDTVLINGQTLRPWGFFEKR